MRADVAIAGAGIIGLALGLELRLRGTSVVVLERGLAMHRASWAAGGMLAAEDPQNPPEMMELARLSWRLYPEWLRKIEDLSGVLVPLRTRQTLQWVGPEVRDGLATTEEIHALAPGLRAQGLRLRLIEEGSVDPRDLCVALPKAFVAAGGTLLEETEMLHVECAAGGILAETIGRPIAAGHFVDCRGAWAGSPVSGVKHNGDAHRIPVEPVKGQMAELRCPPERLRCVVRAPGVYLIPRGDGRVAVGATIERVGFDARVDRAAIAELVHASQQLMPELVTTEPLECWAGLRPGHARWATGTGPGGWRAREDRGQ